VGCVLDQVSRHAVPIFEQRSQNVVHTVQHLVQSVQPGNERTFPYNGLALPIVLKITGLVAFVAPGVVVAPVLASMGFGSTGVRAGKLLVPLQSA
jgi:hypothetical protein